MVNVLVVDDELETLKYLGECLEHEGFHTFACQESHESFKVLESHRIHCVITDLKMPVLCGSDLLNFIRQKYPSIPVIILSGHPLDPQKLIALGASEVLTKPVSVAKLTDSIYESLAENSNQITFQFHHTNLREIRNLVLERLIRIALRKAKGSQIKASRMLGISRQSLTRYMKRYSMDTDKLS